ncbi:glycoside hydrolase, partial [Corynespora cassiicola Philippines]
VGAIASTALAHGTVPSLLIDGESKQGFLLDYYYAQQNGGEIPEHYGWYAENLDNGFVAPNAFGEPDIICHKNAKPASATTSVAAGGKVEFQWTAWPESHMGPVITYVANCGGDCATVDKTTLKFVKIDEAGYEDGQWAAIKMIANNNTWPVTVPETLAPGNYVFRHEIIALHGGGDLNGAQNYPQCFNIEITGSGTDNPEGVLGTELYTPEDAGIHFSPYQGTIDYPIPGPALY